MADGARLGSRSRLTLGGAALVLALAGAQSALGAVTGTVFRDYDADGLRDAREPGFGGIAILAYDARSQVVAQSVTASDGTYSLTVPDGIHLRVEFSGRPEGLQWGPDGPDADTSVQFVTSPRRAVDHAVARPSEFCEKNPRLAVSCFVLGPSTGQSGFVGSGQDAIKDILSAGAGPSRAAATHGQVGAIWGLAYVALSGSGNGTLYASSFVRRHSGLGPNRNPGTIYRIAYSGGVARSPEILTTLPAGADPHPADAEGRDAWLRDPGTWDAPGKVGIGDIDVSEDGSTLYAVNLLDRRLYKVPLVGGGTTTSIPIPQPAGCAAGDWRPFGLGVDDGRVYVGVTCTAQSTQSIDERFAASVFVSDLAVGSFQARPVLVVPLSGAAYPRKCASPGEPSAFNTSASDNRNTGALCVGVGPSANWRPWLAPEPPTSFPSEVPRPMSPWLSDIEFDNGAMILGLRDRFGDQMGNGTPAPAGSSPALYAGVAMGDVLRACGALDRGWTLEANGVCGGVAGGGTGNGEGPGGGEFYNGDDNYWHDQIGQGALAQVPGFEDVASTVFDPFPGREDTYDGGILWSSNANGTRTRSSLVQDGQYLAPATFGKANGLGDLEALCSAAPLEIGNRVWVDTNRDGLQTADELGLANVTLVLRDSAGNALATTVTDSSGTYRFAVEPNRDYRVTLDLTQPRLDIYRPTQAAAGARTTIDSDGALAGSQVVANVRTGGPGANDHTIDFALATTAEYDLLKEVFDPSRNAWIDGDGDGSTRGTNSGEPVVLAPGATARFRITVFNTGIVELRRVRVVDTYCGLDRIIPRIAPSSSVVLTCQRANVVAARVNVASVLQAIPVHVDAGTELPSLPGRSESAAVSVARGTIASRARLAIVKVGPAQAIAGQRVRYSVTVRVSNRSPVAARNVRLVDNCGGGLALIDKRVVGRSENALAVAARWSFGTLRPGESRTVALVFRIDPKRRSPVQNLASASADNAASVSAEVRTRVVPTPAPRPVIVTG